MASVIEVNEHKPTAVFNVNLDEGNDSENLSDTDSNNSEKILKPAELHQKYKSVNLPANATIGQYSNVQSDEQFQKEKQTTEHFQSVMNL